MTNESPGIRFEKLVFEIQKQIDPNARISHNERIRDRLGQLRQFDIVIRGVVAGHELLGVVECKDLNRKVGTPEIESFITKSQDINANFKILISRKGFTKTAIEKSKHHGVQTFSLLPDEKESLGFIVGQTWFADIYRWGKLLVKLNPLDTNESIPDYKPENLKINGKPILEWFKNYLLDNHPMERELGWSAGVEGVFSTPQDIYIDELKFIKCSGVEFYAERILDKRKKFIGITGPGLFDWQNKVAKFGPGSTISTHPVSTDFYEWDIATPEDESTPTVGLLKICIISHNVQFSHNADAIDLDSL